MGDDSPTRRLPAEGQEPTETTISEPATANVTIGRYRLRRKIAEGGMGVVYEAEQSEPRRLVALKVIRGGQYVDDQRVKLFRREAAALGKLKHPGIAAIYEAGRTDAGQHFFAMELVRGVRLDEWLQRRESRGRRHVNELRERLRIFSKICAAVSYAHQRGVVHRDLKPANVIVGADPAASGTGGVPSLPDVKVLDFGLARITDADVAVTTELSQGGLVLGTLPYMSPEQARGNPDELDLRTDVYSLGVVLYELLTGERPFQLGSAAPLEALRVVSEESPVPPSVRWRAAEWRLGALGRDLETIVLKALEKEPGRRYQSVAALAEDVERCLNDQPILARPPSTTEQLRKLIRRHKLASAFAVTVVLLLASFAVVLGVQNRRISQALQRAESEAAKSKAINAFLQETLGSASVLEGRSRDVTVVEALRQALPRIDEAFGAQPEVAATLRRTIGTTYLGLGRYDEAEPLLRSALDTHRRLGGEADRELAESLNALALLLHDRGRLSEAESLYRESLAQLRRLRERGHPDVTERDVTAALNNVALVLSDLGDDAQAERLFREVLAGDRALLGSRNADVATDLNNLGRLLLTRGDAAAAVPLLQEAAMTLRELRHPAVGVVLGNLGAALCAAGQGTDARASFEEAIASGREGLGASHPELGKALAKYGACLLQLGAHAEAEQAWESSRAILVASLGADDAQTRAVVRQLQELRQLRHDRIGSEPAAPARH